MTLTLSAAPLALPPFLILLFVHVHFKWITIPDDDGNLESHFL